jgi:hypothetical protein
MARVMLHGTQIRIDEFQMLLSNLEQLTLDHDTPHGLIVEQHL